MSRQSTDSALIRSERAKQQMTRTLLSELRRGGKRMPKRYQRVLSKIAGRTNG